MNPTITQLIERYLLNELSANERASFEQQLTENDQLLNELILQRQLHEAAKRAAQRNLVQQTAKRYHFRRNVITSTIVVVIVGALTALTFWASNQQAEKTTAQQQQELLTMMEKADQLASLENIVAEYFHLNQEDTVVLSKTGVLLSVPQGAFLLNGKPYAGAKMIQWQEAVKAPDIIKAGLSTYAGDHLLETQGMFALKAFTPDGTQLQVNPKVGVYVQVPVDEHKEGMLLFEGKKMSNGIIDWQNPKPLEKLPQLVDMADLDFFPPGYETKLDHLKWKTGKKERDSLYLSFEEEEMTSNNQMDTISSVPKVENRTARSVVSQIDFRNPMYETKYGVNYRIEAINERQFYVELEIKLQDGYSVLSKQAQAETRIVPINLQAPSNGRFRFIGELEELTAPVPHNWNNQSVLGFTKSVKYRQKVETRTNEQQYEINFLYTVHHANGDENGSYRNFVPIGGIKPIDISLVADTKTMKTEGAESTKIDGKKLFESKCITCHSAHKNQTGPALAGVRQKWASGGAKEGTIYQWVADWRAAAISDPYAVNVSKIKPTEMMRFPELRGEVEQINAIFDYIDGIPNYVKEAQSFSSGIPPSSVLAFWNPKFNNTLLATRDFEKRMKAVHATCDKKVLQLYTNNLNKPLFEIDAQVVKMGYSNFDEFAAEQVGGVHLDNPHMNNLRQFYAGAVAQLKKELKTDRHFIRKQEKAWDNELAKLRTEETKRSARRQSLNNTEEAQFNYQAMVRQLGNRPLIGFTIFSDAPAFNCDMYAFPPSMQRAQWRANRLRQLALAQSKQQPASNNNTTNTLVQNGTRSSSGMYSENATSAFADLFKAPAYESFSVDVKNSSHYGKVMVYLFPHQLTSFERLNGSNGKFTGRLNKEMQYDLLVVGIAESGFYLLERKNIHGSDITVDELDQVSELEWNRRVEALNAGRGEKPMAIFDELEWLTKEQQNYKVKRLRQEQAVFRNTIRPIVYPCMSEEWQPDGDDVVPDVPEIQI